MKKTSPDPLACNFLADHAPSTFQKVLGASWAFLGHLWNVLGLLLAAHGPLLEVSGPSLVPSWLPFGWSWVSLGCILALRKLPPVDFRCFSEGLGRVSWPFGGRFGHRWIDIEHLFVHETQTCFHLRFFSSLKCGGLCAAHGI